MAQRPRKPASRTSSEDGTERLASRLISAAFHGRNADVSAALREGAPVDTKHDKTGLTALHVAAGTNNLSLAKLLVEEFQAPFGPDAFGRWPTVVAAECKADEEFLDYIVEAEAAFLEKEPASSHRPV